MLYRTRWAAVALMAALTLRHAIIRSGTNTLEGYFHPRQLAFAIGAFAVVSFLRGRYGVMWVLVAAAGALHPTTALWFAIWLGVATLLAEPRLRLPTAVAVAAGALALGVGARRGPARGTTGSDGSGLARRRWRSKDYLFPLNWPAIAWLVNLGYVPLILWVFRRRRAAGLLVPREGALVAGCLSLVLVFAATLPLERGPRRARHSAAARADLLDARLPRRRLRRLGRG